MNERLFESGERVALSATFLRSICRNAAKGWPTTLDKGPGTFVGALGDIAYVLWDEETEGCARGIHVANLVSKQPLDLDLHLDAMNAEHTQKRGNSDI